MLFRLRRPEGHGLGLRSVRDRLELVGGRREVDAAPGRGTRVTISVPVSDAPTPQA